MAAAGDKVKLLGTWPSPFAIRVKIALNLKGVEYENLEEDLENKSELLLKTNPVYKQVPVLIHAGRSISESMIVVQYIDEVWSDAGPSILPSDPYDRAIARFWAAYVDDKCFSSMLAIIKAETKEAKEEATEQLLAGLQLLEEAFVKCSKGKGFFNGDTIGYTDIALGCYLVWFRVLEKKVGFKILDEVKVPLLVGWGERFCLNDAVKEVMPEIEKLLEYAKGLEDKWSATAPTN